MQLGVAWRLILLWAFTTLLTGFVTVLLRFFANPGAGMASMLTSPNLWAPSLIAFVVTLPIASLHLIRFSHRFAGPVHRLRGELRALANGEQRRPLKFRKGDYWTDLADDFNRVADRLRCQSATNASSEQSSPVEVTA